MIPESLSQDPIAKIQVVTGLGCLVVIKLDRNLILLEMELILLILVKVRFHRLYYLDNKTIRTCKTVF